MVILFNTTFNNISVISWQRVLVVEETGVPEVNHWHVAIHWQALSHNVVSSTPSWAEFELTAYVVICTDYIGSCKSNNHTFMTTTASLNKLKTQNVKETNDDLQSTTQKTKEYGYRNCEIDCDKNTSTEDFILLSKLKCLQKEKDVKKCKTDLSFYC